MIRHAGHGDGFAGRLTAVGKGDIEQVGRPLGIAVEKLVEIPHPVEQQLIRMLGLDAQVLLHHRCVAVELGSHGFPGGVERTKRGSESSASKERQPADAHTAASESLTLNCDRGAADLLAPSRWPVILYAHPVGLLLGTYLSAALSPPRNEV